MKPSKMLACALLTALLVTPSVAQSSPRLKQTAADSSKTAADSAKIAKIAAAPTAGLKAAVITLEEMVDPGMAAYAGRAIRRAMEKNPDLIVFEVNTFGGRLDAAFDISDTILAATSRMSSDGKTPIRTIALVNKKAISAGALISLSAGELYMRPSTTIGDCAPVIESEEGPKVMGEKIQSPLRARFRTLAERNGYPSLLSQAMVSDNLEVVELSDGDSTRVMLASQVEELSADDQETWSNRKTLVRAGELLTLTNIEAEKFGFSRGTVTDLDQLMGKLGVVKWERIEISWAEQVARFLAAIAPLLMLVGFGALYLEMQTPGFGFFGVVGIACLAIVFGGQFVTGLADNAALGFLLLGITLLLVEMFIAPGLFVPGALGVASLLVAMGLSIGEASPRVPGEVASTSVDWARLVGNLGTLGWSAALALLFPLAMGKWIIPRLPARYGIALAADLGDSYAPALAEHEGVPSAGARGTVATVLRPSGSVLIDHHRYEASALSGFIEKGHAIVVVRVEGQHLVVRPASEAEAGPSGSEPTVAKEPS